MWVLVCVSATVWRQDAAWVRVQVEWEGGKDGCAGRSSTSSRMKTVCSREWLLCRILYDSYTPSPFPDVYPSSKYILFGFASLFATVSHNCIKELKKSPEDFLTSHPKVWSDSKVWPLVQIDVWYTVWRTHLFKLACFPHLHNFWVSSLVSVLFPESMYFMRNFCLCSTVKITVLHN